MVVCRRSSSPPRPLDDLALRQMPSEALKKGPIQAQTKKQLRILLVDDELPFLRGLGRVIRFNEHDVHISGTREDALRKLNEGNFDVLVTDFHMPGMSCVDFVRTARQLRPDMQIIVASEGAEEGELTATIDAGANLAIRKPKSNLKILIDAIEGRRQQTTDS